MPTLNWIGKEKVVSHHQDVPYRVLEHKYGFTAEKGEQSAPTNSGNKIIHIRTNFILKENRILIWVIICWNFS